ncbi:magnesium ion transporter [Penicillium maclennaniae]|uniref:magnesium ion transporter n=1 Tax=Penicillium maclennaniae TaxID=1343394 RepID=UPI0025419746|nr:magnesium ion transporter [Penicillium maclennaniae]KAJ5684243.1 magnesium ion transporter [Penicillium maclennaniae]
MFCSRFGPCQARPLAEKAFGAQKSISRKTIVQVHFPRNVFATSPSTQNIAGQPVRAFHRPDRKDVGQSQQLYELSLGLSRIPMNGNAEIQHTLYDAKNASVSTKMLTKLAIANQYRLSTRDLRSIDLPSTGYPHILVREQTILIYMFSLRLLVQTDQVLMFHVEGAVDHEQANQWRVFNHDIEEKLRGDHGAGVAVSLPFELRVLEAALASTTSTIEAEYLLAKEQIAEALRQLDLQMAGDEESRIHSDLRVLLDLVQILSGIEQRARHVRDAIQEVLNDDADMAAMHLTDKQAGRPHAPEDHQDVEYLLEAYYKTSDAVVQKAESLLGKIKRKEENIQSILNVRRNQIMVLETKVEIAMLGITSATLVAGFYGMNVTNYFEDSAWAFGVVTSLCLVGIAVIWRFGLRQLRQIQKVQI